MILTNYGHDDQGVSAIDADPEAAQEFLDEEDTSGFDYDASIAAVATRPQPSRPGASRNVPNYMLSILLALNW